MRYELVDVDFLIIGGGSAGCMAAIRALEINPQLKVAIFEKSDLKYGGSIARGMDALNIVAIPGLSSPELYVEAITLGTAGICDVGPSYVMAARSFELMQKLESWGVLFPRKPDGSYTTLKYHVKGEFQVCMQEPELKTMIAKKAQDLGAKVFNRTMALSLLKDGERIAGAVGMNVRTGSPIVCRAKTVLLSNGGTARFTLSNTGQLYSVFDFPGNTGDGYALGMHAGASLTGIEYCQVPLVLKDAQLPLLAISLTRGGLVKDVDGNVLKEKELSGFKAMGEAHYGGRGPVQIQHSHLSEEKIQEIESILFSTERPIWERFLKNRGLDFRKDDMEMWPTDCQLCGGHGLAGLRVNEKTETCVPGLYAAGDAASVPKQHLSGAFVFGEVAAEQAVAYSSEHELPALDRETIEAVMAERDRRCALKGDLELDEIERKTRRLCGDYLISPKNETKFSSWRKWSPRLREDTLRNANVRNAHDLAHTYELENILFTADMSALAGSTRKESRWGRQHLRTDYPERNDADWLCHVILREDADGKLSAEKARIQTQFDEEVAL